MMRSVSRFNVKQRPIPDETRQVAYAELARFIAGGGRSLRPLMQHGSSKVRTWAEAALARSLDYQFARFANYLWSGTLAPLMSGPGLETTKVHDELRLAPATSLSPYGTDPMEMEEMNLLRAEFLEEQDSWARDGDGGWYYD